MTHCSSAEGAWRVGGGSGGGAREDVRVGPLVGHPAEVLHRAGRCWLGWCLVATRSRRPRGGPGTQFSREGGPGTKLSREGEGGHRVVEKMVEGGRRDAEGRVGHHRETPPALLPPTHPIHPVHSSLYILNVVGVVAGREGDVDAERLSGR